MAPAPDSTHGLSWQRVWLLLAVVACLLTLAGAPLPHVDSDAALFGKVAKQILASGDWLTLHHPGKPDWIVDKPPLTFWLMAVSLKIGGETDAALRAWQLLMQIGLVFAVYRLTRLSAGREEGLLAAVMMATFQQAFYFSMAPQHDVPVTLFLTLALYGSLRYRERESTALAVFIGLSVALAVLTKGVLWVGVFALIVIVDAAIAARQGDLGRWRWERIAVATAVCVVAAAPWFIVGAVRQGAPFVETFFVGENGIQRFLHPFLGSGVVPVRGRLVLLMAYVPILMLGMLPWTGWLPGVVREGWQSLNAGPRSVRLCAVWFGVFFLLLSFSQGDRIMRYLLPLYPPLAVLAARWTVRAFEAPRELRIAAAISLLFGMPLIVATGWFYFLYAPDDVRIYLPLLVPPVIVFSLALTAFAVATWVRRGRRAVVVLVTGVLVSYALLYAMIMLRWETIWPWPAITSTVNRLYRPGDRVLVVGSAGAETHFAAYWIEARVEAVDDDALTAAWQQGRVFGLLSPQTAARLSERLRPTVLVTTPLGWTLVTNR